MGYLELINKIMAGLIWSIDDENRKKKKKERRRKKKVPHDQLEEK